MDEYDHTACHAEIDRLKAKLDQCATELDEAAKLIFVHFQRSAGLFFEAAKAARDK